MFGTLRRVMGRAAPPPNEKAPPGSPAIESIPEGTALSGGHAASSPGCAPTLSLDSDDGMGVSSSPRPRHTGSEIEADGPTRNLRPRPGDAAPEAGAARRGEVSQVSASAHANREGDPIEIGAVGSLAGRPEEASRASKFVFQKNALARASQMNMRSALCESPFHPPAS